MPAEFDVYDELFPGNQNAFQSLVATVSKRRSVAVVGAGASATTHPTWLPLISKLISEGESRGVFTNSYADQLRTMMKSDALEAASYLEEQYGRPQFRAQLSTIFGERNRFGSTHEKIVSLPLSGIVTLNYDHCLEDAFIRTHALAPDVGCWNNNGFMARWHQEEITPTTQIRVLHWHGIADQSDSMILTSDDYDKFYGDPQRVTFIQSLWQSSQALFVGFSFSDPFFTRAAETALRSLQSDNRHFALIGVRTNEDASELKRRTFSRKYRITPIFYPVIVDTTNGAEDHSALDRLLDELAKPSPSDSFRANEAVIPTDHASGDLELPASDDAAVTVDWDSQLFRSPEGVQLFSPFRLFEVNGSDDSSMSEEVLSIDELVSSSNCLVFTARQEAGSTTLSRHLAHKLVEAGQTAYLRDANVLPNYRKKLEADPAFSAPNKSGQTLILDNFDPQRHERLIKEIMSIRGSVRVVLFTTGGSTEISYLSEISVQSPYRHILVEYLSRPEVRILAKQMFDTGDDDLISGIVEKTYNDLLELCIPLTPGNVIMYLRVLRKEGDFSPLNRVSIIDRYIREILRRPSDAYLESFNADNRIAVVAAFVFDLHSKSKTSFDILEWNSFCLILMEDELISFDEKSLIDDLIKSRIIASNGRFFRFRYRLFYSYFLGSHVANRPAKLVSFVSTGSHVSIEGLIEVLCGLSENSDLLVDDLIARTDVALASFYDAFKMGDFNPYDKLEWRTNEQSENELWERISENVAEGPLGTRQLDAVKASPEAERRTQFQAVTIIDIADFEKLLCTNAMNLMSAIRESKSLSGSTKIRAHSSLLRYYEAVLRIGFVYVPLIANQSRFVWSDVGFHNVMFDSMGDIQEQDRRNSIIASVLPGSVASKAADDIGTRKLGELVRHFATKRELTSMLSLFNYSLLLRSKPRDWEQLAHDYIVSTSRNSVFMRFMLDQTFRQFHQEVNSNAERTSLKRLIATIHAKRRLRKEDPGAKAVTRTLSAFPPEMFDN